MVHSRIYKRYGSGVPNKGTGVRNFLRRLGPLAFLGLAVILVFFSYICAVNIYSLKYYKLEEAKLKLSKSKSSIFKSLFWCEILSLGKVISTFPPPGELFIAI